MTGKHQLQCFSASVVCLRGTGLSHSVSKNFRFARPQALTISVVGSQLKKNLEINIQCMTNALRKANMDKK